jgi:hypothetical protein
VFQYILFHSAHKITQTATKILVKQVSIVEEIDKVHKVKDANKNKLTRTGIRQPAGSNKNKTTTKR